MNKKIRRKKTSARTSAAASVAPAVATQLDRIKARLEELLPNITTGDRREASQQLAIGKSTISKYLNGHILNAETGLEILAFFNDRVTAREDRLKTMCI